MKTARETEPAHDPREARREPAPPRPRDAEAQHREDDVDFRETTEGGYGWGV